MNPDTIHMLAEALRQFLVDAPSLDREEFLRDAGFDDDAVDAVEKCFRG